VSAFAGDSVPARTRRAPSCSSRRRDFSSGGREGLSRTDEWTDSLPVGLRYFSLSILDALVFIISRSSARTRWEWLIQRVIVTFDVDTYVKQCEHINESGWHHGLT